MQTAQNLCCPICPTPLLLAAVLITQAIAVIIVGFGILVVPIPWPYIGLVWIYCLVWVFLEDWAKMDVYNHFSLTGLRHRRFLYRIKTNPRDVQKRRRML